MSRYVIQALRPAKHKVVVGWDAPLNTFFAKVDILGADEEDEPVLWVGATPPQIHDLDVLMKLLIPYAVIPHSVIRKLLVDSD